MLLFLVFLLVALWLLGMVTTTTLGGLATPSRTTGARARLRAALLLRMDPTSPLRSRLPLASIRRGCEQARP